MSIQGYAINTAIIGASPKPDRFAYRAASALTRHGHKVFLVNPFRNEIEGERCYSRVSDISEPIHTVTLYVNPHHLLMHLDSIIAASPKRVIMNPGTEDSAAASLFEQSGIDLVRDCTLLMLSGGRY